MSYEVITTNLMNWLNLKFKLIINWKYFDKTTLIITLLNPIVILPQLVAVVKATNVESISVVMWGTFVVIQITFTFIGIKTKNFNVFVSMIASVLLSLGIVIATLIKQ